MNSQRQTGLSLVEILVAMVISLFLLGGVIQVYSGSKTTYGFSEALSRNQENGRFAMDTITRDLRMAGFRGCATNKFVNNLNEGGDGYTPSLYDFFGQPAVDGTENDGLNDSDSITIRGPAPGQANIVEPYNSPLSGQIFTNSSDLLKDKDIVLLTNCKGADIFQITGINEQGAAKKLSVVHNTGNNSPGNFNPDPDNCGGGIAHCLSQTYGGDSSILKMQTITYNIATGESGQPALFRQLFADDPEELVDGVEQLQALYGIDTNAGDTTPNQYVTSDNVADWDQVTAVRIMLLLRSPSTVSMDEQKYDYNGQQGLTSDDRRLRQVFSTTIALRNLLNRN